MTDKLILAVDLGTSGMKVALVTIDGHVLGWEGGAPLVDTHTRRRRGTKPG